MAACTCGHGSLADWKLQQTDRKQLPHVCCHAKKIVVQILVIKSTLVSTAVKNVKPMHTCFPQHLCMGSERMKQAYLK